jgi:hypothetical protein
MKNAPLWVGCASNQTLQLYRIAPAKAALTASRGIVRGCEVEAVVRRRISARHR